MQRVALYFIVVNSNALHSTVYCKDAADRDMRLPHRIFRMMYHCKDEVKMLPTSTPGIYAIVLTTCNSIIDIPFTRYGQIPSSSAISYPQANVRYCARRASWWEYLKMFITRKVTPPLSSSQLPAAPPLQPSQSLNVDSTVLFE